MSEKKLSEEEQQILLQYEVELRKLVGGIVSLSPIFGVKLKDVQEHTNKILKEMGE